MGHDWVSANDRSAEVGLPKLLIVDDNEGNRLSFTASCEQEGTLIFAASTAEEALELSEQHSFALGLLDINLSGTSGLILADQFRSRAKRVFPIIFVTAGEFDDTLRKRCYDVGCVDFIHKPFDPKIIQHKVSVFLDLDYQRRLSDYQYEKMVTQNDQLANINQALQEKTHEVDVREEEKRKIERQLVQSQKMETVGQLSGGLAHDFNNVLSGIIGTLQVIEFKYAQEGKNIDEDDTLKGLRTIRTCSERARDLVSQLMTLSRKTDLEFKQVKIYSAIRNVINICSNSFDKSIDIEMHLGPDEPVVDADITQVEQVILNLCINARDSIQGSGKLVVSTESVACDEGFLANHPDADMGKEYVCISVRDTGTGMDDTTLSRIFDPFFTTKEKGKGTGLGLAVCYQIIQQHKGFVTVYSEVGVGSIFRIYLPRVSKDAEVRQADGDQISLPKGEGTILVIDDEPVVRFATKGMLEAYGYTVLLASHGEEGVEVYQDKQHDIDMVIVDMVMPRMSGRDTFEALRDINPQVRVALTSGFKRDHNIESLLAQGVKTFIQKPVTLEALIGKVHNILADKMGMPRFGFKRVLLAEDDDGLRRVMVRHLSKQGFDVVACENGNVAWQAFLGANANPFDIVVSDLAMPELDGLGLVEKIRKADANIPVLILTAHDDKEAVKASLRLHVDEFLAKPVSVGELEASIERLFEARSN